MSLLYEYNSLGQISVNIYSESSYTVSWITRGLGDAVYLELEGLGAIDLKALQSKIKG